MITYTGLQSFMFMTIACALIASVFLILARPARTRRHQRTRSRQVADRLTIAAVAADGHRYGGYIGRGDCPCTWYGPLGNIQLDPCKGHAYLAGNLIAWINLVESSELEDAR